MAVSVSAMVGHVLKPPLEMQLTRYATRRATERPSTTQDFHSVLANSQAQCATRATQNPDNLNAPTSHQASSEREIHQEHDRCRTERARTSVSFSDNEASIKAYQSRSPTHLCFVLRVDLVWLLTITPCQPVHLLVCLPSTHSTMCSLRDVAYWPALSPTTCLRIIGLAATPASTMQMSNAKFMQTVRPYRPRTPPCCPCHRKTTLRRLALRNMAFNGSVKSSKLGCSNARIEKEPWSTKTEIDPSTYWEYRICENSCRTLCERARQCGHPGPRPTVVSPPHSNDDVQMPAAS